MRYLELAWYISEATTGSKPWSCSLRALVIGRCIDAEAMLSAGGMQDDAVLRVLLHVALVDHLVQELRGDLALVRLVLELADAASELLELFEVSSDLRLPEDLLLLGLFDLGLGASPLAARLHEVCGDAFGDCDKKESG